MSLGVVIGRFQVPKLHAGHCALLDKSIMKHDHTLILIGVPSFTGTKKNPLDFPTVRAMVDSTINSSYRYKTTILPIFDVRSDEEWSKSVDHLIHTLYPFDKVTIYHGRDSFKEYYSGKHVCEAVDVPNILSGTALRDSAGVSPLQSEDFRRGMIYQAYHKWPRINPTVDIAVYDEVTNKILLGTKKDSPLFRFPGGFVDARDGSFHNAAVRELQEETGIAVDALDTLEFVGSTLVNDGRSTPDNVIMTSLFLLKKRSEYFIPQAADDLNSVEFVDMGGLINSDMVPEHICLLDMVKIHLMKKYGRNK